MNLPNWLIWGGLLAGIVALGYLVLRRGGG